MTMQTIMVSYLSATSNNGARLKARTNTETLTIPYPHKLHRDEIYLFGAMKLAEKLDWNFQFVEGILPDGSRVFVPVTDESLCTTNYLSGVE